MWYNMRVAMRVITTNKRANFEYFILEEFTAGISLVGGEVKSIRNGSVSIKDSFVHFRSGEAYIINMYIKRYSFDNLGNVDELRPRKLLLHKREIDYLIGKVTEKGLTIVPTKLYFDKNLVKLDIALCRGKHLYDKRESIKQRDIKRDIQIEVAR